MAKVDSVRRMDERFPFNLGRRFPVVYSLALIIFCIVNNVFPALDFLVLCLFICAAYIKRAQRFMKDWFPFVALLMAYGTMRGITDNIANIVHVTEPIKAELCLFGTIPTMMLQQFYRTPILDWVGALFYSLHFLVPFVFGFVLWNRSSENYRKYTVALLITSYSALITFLAYPSAPPWFGIDAERILFQMDGVIGVPLYATIYGFVAPNPFAAIPSLHAAYPWLIFLYAIKIKRIRAFPLLFFPFGVWFSTVYLGEHYVVDLIAGVIYSTVAYFLAEKLTACHTFIR
jgi:membrane-associated phospholipid phosphatase